MDASHRECRQLLTQLEELQALHDRELQVIQGVSLGWQHSWGIKSIWRKCSATQGSMLCYRESRCRRGERLLIHDLLLLAALPPLCRIWRSSMHTTWRRRSRRGRGHGWSSSGRPTSWSRRRRQRGSSGPRLTWPPGTWLGQLWLVLIMHAHPCPAGSKPYGCRVSSPPDGMLHSAAWQGGTSRAARNGGRG